MDPPAVKHVVIVNDHAFINGGQAKIAIESALSLKREGLDVSFTAGVGPADPRLGAAGIECSIVGGEDILSDPNRFRAARQGMWNTKAARVLEEHIGSRNVCSTVVHIHGWSKALSPSIGPVVTRSRAAHVFTLHEYFLACPNGGFYDYRAGKICTKRALGLQCLTTPCDPRNSRHKAWRIARQAVLWTAGQMPRGLREIIYLSAKQLDIMGAYLPEDARRHYLPNPVENGVCERVLAEENDLFLFVGRLSPEKGAEVVANAARIAGMRIAFAGDGECRNSVLLANNDAEMLGWLDFGEIGNWMRRARCIVFPSLWYETYGLVVAEALRCGVPVLVSEGCVASELVSHGISGFRVEANNVDSWVQYMIKLKSADTVRALSYGAYEAGARLSDYRKYCEKLIAIYQLTIARKM